MRRWPLAAEDDAGGCAIIRQEGVASTKVFYGQEPPSGESTTTKCGVNYQLLAVIH